MNKKEIEVAELADKNYKCLWWEEYIYYPLWRKYDWIRNIPHEIKYFCQRGIRGYSDRDVWGLDFYLESWLPEALQQLSKKTNGWPGELMTFKEWQATLRRMAKGFKAVRDEGNVFDYKDIKAKIKRDKRAYQLEQESLKLMTKWFSHLWW